MESPDRCSMRTWARCCGSTVLPLFGDQLPVFREDARLTGPSPFSLRPSMAAAISAIVRSRFPEDWRLHANPAARPALRRGSLRQNSPICGSVASAILPRRVDFHVVVDVGTTARDYLGFVLRDCRIVAERKRDRDSFLPNRPDRHIYTTRRVESLTLAIKPVASRRKRSADPNSQHGQFFALEYTTRHNLEDTE